MFNLIEKLSNNFVGTNQNKTQIILTHTSRDVEEYLTSLKYRMNGKFPRIPHYVVSKHYPKNNIRIFFIIHK